jgi:hypothetical protein
MPRSLIQSFYNLFDSNPMKKPPSLPNNWPNSSPEDLEFKPKRIIKIGCDQMFYFNSNIVKTSKYEIYNFLPKFLLEEFNPVSLLSSFANVINFSISYWSICITVHMVYQSEQKLQTAIFCW